MNIYVEFDEGWNTGGVKLLRSIDGLQPDAPSTLDYESYPEPFVAPFHYDAVSAMSKLGHRKRGRAGKGARRLGPATRGEQAAGLRHVSRHRAG